jgi:inosine/xanthosine triphosphatase
MSYQVVVASKNPVKIEAVRIGFARVFSEVEMNILAVSVPSGVSDQPMTDEETLKGAQNRVKAARDACPEADYWAGIEGGINLVGGGMTAFAWVVIQGRDHFGIARTGAFFLPDSIVELIHNGVELGVADDIIFKRSGSKTGNGAIGILTNDLIDRTELYSPAVIMALIPFMSPALYHKVGL